MRQSYRSSHCSIFVNAQTASQEPKPQARLFFCTWLAFLPPDTGGWGEQQEERSYGANNWLYNFSGGETAIQGRPTEWNWRTKNTPRAYEVPVFADTMWRGGGPYTHGTRGDPPQFESQWLGYDREMMHFCIDRHNGFINILFMDASARAVGIKELSRLKWHRQFDQNGPWTKGGGVGGSDWPAWVRRFKDY